MQLMGISIYFHLQLKREVDTSGSVNRYSIINLLVLHLCFCLPWCNLSSSCTSWTLMCNSWWKRLVLLHDPRTTMFWQWSADCRLSSCSTPSHSYCHTNNDDPVQARHIRLNLNNIISGDITTDMIDARAHGKAARHWIITQTCPTSGTPNIFASISN